MVVVVVCADAAKVARVFARDLLKALTTLDHLSINFVAVAAAAVEVVQA